MGNKISSRWGLKIGDRVRCTESLSSCLNKGKLYRVVEIDKDSDAIIFDEGGWQVYPEESTCFFEPVKEGE